MHEEGLINEEAVHRKTDSINCCRRKQSKRLKENKQKSLSWSHELSLKIKIRIESHKKQCDSQSEGLFMCNK